jgi:hypothetical protein
VAATPVTTVRLVEVGRGLWGLALLTAPGQVMTHVHHVRVDRTSVVVARVLGARHLAQAALSGVDPSPEVLAMGTWVDTAHAATGVALAVVDRGRARGALTDVAVAATWALAGWRDLDHPDRQAPGHDRRRDRLAVAVLRVVPGGRSLLRRARIG